MKYVCMHAYMHVFMHVYEKGKMRREREKNRVRRERERERERVTHFHIIEGLVVKMLDGFLHIVFGLVLDKPVPILQGDAQDLPVRLEQFLHLFPGALVGG